MRQMQTIPKTLYYTPTKVPKQSSKAPIFLHQIYNSRASPTKEIELRQDKLNRKIQKEKERKKNREEKEKRGNNVKEKKNPC